MARKDPPNMDRMGDNHGKGYKQILQEQSFAKRENETNVEFENRRKEAGYDSKKANAIGSSDSKQEKLNHPYEFISQSPGNSTSPAPSSPSSPSPAQSPASKKENWENNIDKTSTTPFQKERQSKDGQSEREKSVEQTQPNTHNSLPEAHTAVKSLSTSSPQKEDWVKNLDKTSNTPYSKERLDKFKQQEKEKEKDIEKDR